MVNWPEFRQASPNVEHSRIDDEIQAVAQYVFLKQRFHEIHITNSNVTKTGSEETVSESPLIFGNLTLTFYRELNSFQGDYNAITTENFLGGVNVKSNRLFNLLRTEHAWKAIKKR